MMAKEGVGDTERNDWASTAATAAAAIMPDVSFRTGLRLEPPARFCFEDELVCWIFCSVY